MPIATIRFSQEAKPSACYEHGGTLHHFGDTVKGQEQYEERAPGRARTTARLLEWKAALATALPAEK